VSGFLAGSALVIVGFLLFRIWEKGYIVPALVLLLYGIHPATMLNSISLSSEPLYLLLSALALWTTVEMEEKERQFAWPLVTGLLMALSFYARAAALALIGAVWLDLSLKRRWRTLALVCATSILGILPWWIWRHFHNEAARLPEFIFNTDYLSDFLQIARSKGFVSVITQNLALIAVGIPKVMAYPYQADLQRITQLTAWLGLPLTVLTSMGFVRTFRVKRTRVLHFYVVLYLLLLTLWPYPPGERFLLPLLPWLLLFLGAEIREIAIRADSPKTLTQEKGRAIRRPLRWLIPVAILGACLASLGVHCFSFAADLNQRLKDLRRVNQEMGESFQWIRQYSTPTDCLMAYPNPLYFLHTGRQTAPMTFDPTKLRTRPRFLVEPIRKYHLRYLVTGELDFTVYTTEIAEAMRKELQHILQGKDGLNFRMVFSSSKGKYEIYRIDQ
jgi:hypothetical protein